MSPALAALIGAQRAEGEERLELVAERRTTDLTTLVETLHPQCFGWALACCDNRREDAEDVLQDVYAGVLDHKLRFDGRSSLKTWLFGVIRQKAIGRIRKERLREFLGIRNVARIDTPAPSSLPDDDAVASDQRALTRRALAQLPRRQREIMMLVFYHDMTIVESARAMEVSLGSARTHYDRGKKRLAVLLSGERQ
jgi:RNA polymerase sigma factor (sigma-70 family)